jgi:hypothetical protein
MYRYIANSLENGTFFSIYLCVEISLYVETNFKTYSNLVEHKKLENFLGVPERLSGRAWLSYGNVDIVEDDRILIDRKVKILRLLSSGRKIDLVKAQKLAESSISATSRIYGF